VSSRSQAIAAKKSVVSSLPRIVTVAESVWPALSGSGLLSLAVRPLKQLSSYAGSRIR
jgi:hypothetical protein